MARYLVVDDEETNRVLLKEFLAEFAPCDVAANGAEGLSLFKRARTEGNPYSLICVDLLMPKMNGLALVRKIRDIESAGMKPGERRTSIFVITSSDSTWDKAELLLDNLCDDYIVKPFNRNMLMVKLSLNPIL